MDEQVRRRMELWDDYLADAKTLAREAAEGGIQPFQILLQDVKTGLSQTLNCRYIGIGLSTDGGKRIVIVTPGFKTRFFDAMQFNYTLLK